MRIGATWVIAAALGAAPGCGRQRGDERTVDEPVADAMAPQLVARLTADPKAPAGVQLVFSFDERAAGALVVRPADRGALSLADVDAAEDRVEFAARAFETVRLSVADLESGRDYLAHLVARDEAGNAFEAPASVAFRTPELEQAGALGGKPPLARQGVPWTFAPSGVRAGCALRIVRGPAWVQLAPAADRVHGVPVWSADAARPELELELTGAGCRGRHVFTVASAGDPLFEYSWHINPAARGAFSWLGTPAAVDIKLAPALAAGLTGRGVHVTLVDSGMLVAHPDLAPNVDKARNLNLDALVSGACTVCDPHDTSPPRAPGEPGDQGTAVAGIIAAAGWNGIGGRGVAPEARISAYNLAARRLTASEDDHLRVFSMETDVVAHSAAEGSALLRRLPFFDFDAYDAAQRRRVQLGRGGKGTVYLKAAGDLAHLGGQAALDQRGATSWGMVVGAYNGAGVRSRRSNPGANLWISGPGGEAGYQSDPRELGGAAVDFHPSVIAPDIYGEEIPCSAGFAKAVRYFTPGVDPSPSVHARGRSSGFNLGWHPLNDRCMYTATVPATPAATGAVAGVVALLLQARPDLGWRDVKRILAKTAQPIDPLREPVLASVGGRLYETTLPWTVNAAGQRFHNWYGFGAVDAAAAVALATAPDYRPLGPQQDTGWILASTSAQRIPPASISGAFSDFFCVHDLSLESVQVRVNVLHEDVSHLSLELISPGGTRSILKPMQDGARLANMREAVFLANAFYGERSRGSWQLRVIDGKQGGRAGTLSSWYFRITGHGPGPADDEED